MFLSKCQFAEVQSKKDSDVPFGTNCKTRVALLVLVVSPRRPTLPPCKFNARLNLLLSPIDKQGNHHQHHARHNYDLPPFCRGQIFRCPLKKEGSGGF